MYLPDDVVLEALEDSDLGISYDRVAAHGMVMLCFNIDEEPGDTHRRTLDDERGRRFFLFLTTDR